MFSRPSASSFYLGPRFGPEAATSLLMEVLGKYLLFDTALSTPPGQSCAACHAPETGFTGPDSQVNLTTVAYPGTVHTRFGNRKPPTAAYGGDSPVLFFLCFLRLELHAELLHETEYVDFFSFLDDLSILHAAPVERAEFDRDPRRRHALI